MTQSHSIFADQLQIIASFPHSKLRPFTSAIYVLAVTCTVVTNKPQNAFASKHIALSTIKDHISLRYTPGFQCRLLSPKSTILYNGEISFLHTNRPLPCLHVYHTTTLHNEFVRLCMLASKHISTCHLFMFAGNPSSSCHTLTFPLQLLLHKSTIISQWTLDSRDHNSAKSGR